MKLASYPHPLWQENRYGGLQGPAYFYGLKSNRPQRQRFHIHLQTDLQFVSSSIQPIGVGGLFPIIGALERFDPPQFVETSGPANALTRFDPSIEPEHSLSSPSRNPLMASRRLGKHRRQMMQSGLMCTLLVAVDRSGVPALPKVAGSAWLASTNEVPRLRPYFSTPFPCHAPTGRQRCSKVNNKNLLRVQKRLLPSRFFVLRSLRMRMIPARHDVVVIYALGSR